MKKQKKYAGKTEKEWSDWGVKFGKRIDKGSKEFCEEMEALSEKFESYMECKGKQIEKSCKDWWVTTFGLIGPLIGSLIGIVCFSFVIWVLQLMNMSLHNLFISAICSFFSMNLPWIFLALIFFGYSNYAAKKFSRIFWIISPIITAVGVVIGIWFSVLIFNLINSFVLNSALGIISDFLYSNMMLIFMLVAILGYFIKIIKISISKWRCR
jgi:hypothetical protein